MNDERIVQRRSPAEIGARYERARDGILKANPAAAAGFKDALSRADFSLDHAPDWVFEVFSSGVPSAGGVSSTMDVPGLYRPAENVLMVFACLTARREAIGRVPIRLSDAEGNLVESGPVVDLLQRPSPTLGLTWSQYIRQLETYKALYNHVVIAKVNRSTGSSEYDPTLPPDELIPLSPAYIWPFMGAHAQTGVPVAMKYRYADPYTGKITLFDRDELIVHRGFNPHAPLGPLSPLNVLRRTMQAELAAREQNLALQVNDARPAGVLENDQFMHREQAEEVLNFWEQRLQGYQKRGKMMATWGGLKFHEIGLSPVEMDYLNSLKFWRSDFYIVFRVVPAMVYEFMPVSMGNGNESNESQTHQWWADVGLGELDLFAELHQPIVDLFYRSGRSGRAGRSMARTEREMRARSLRRAGRAESSGYSLWFDENAVPALVEHRLAKTSQLKDYVGMGWQPDEAAEYLDLGLPPHPDNLGRVAFSLQTIGEEVGGQRSEVSGQKSEGQKSEVSGQIAPVDPQMTGRLERVAELLRSAANVGGGQSDFARFVAPLEKQAAKRWSRFFMEQRARVMQRMEAGVIGHRSLVGRAESDQADEAVAHVFPRAEEDRALVARMQPLMEAHLKAGWEHLQGEIGDMVKGFQIEDPRAMAAIEKRTIQGLRVNDTTEDELRTIFRDGFANGASTGDIADAIAKYYADNGIGADKVRPATAAATQTTGIVNDGRMLAAREAGGLLKFWIHGDKAKEPREAHVEAARFYDEHPIELDAPFVINGHECDAPGSPELPVSETANCSCSVGFRKAGER